MTEESRWWRRLEDRRKAQGLSVDRLCAHLGIKRATYYFWRGDAKRHPRDAKTVEAIGSFLDEDVNALASEMGLTATPSHKSFLEAAAAREFSVRLYQSHVQAMARALGMSEASTRHEGLDVVVRLLRERLPEQPNPVRAGVAVVPVRRGHRRYEPYHYQIYVLPEELITSTGDELPLSAPEVLERVRKKIDMIMDGTLLSVTREHSTELALPLFRNRADLLLYPGLLDPRPPDWSGPSTGVPDVLVISVYYAGAPDVAALLAANLGHGYSTFDHLARLVATAGLRALPNSRLTSATERIAQAVLAGETPTAGPTVWATDDPTSVLGLRAQALVEKFPGIVVLLELSDSAIEYAAQRLCWVDGRPTHHGASKWEQKLRQQQHQLRDIVSRRESIIVRQIALPPQVEKGSDGYYPDAVHTMFDCYDTMASEIFSEIKADAALEEVLRSQIHRVDARTQRGAASYANERQEVRCAVDRVRRLRRELQLGRFMRSLTPDTGKPQFLLLFAPQGGSPVVLKAYGKKRPGEAWLQKLWHHHGVRTVDILDAGDEPTSWILMAPLKVAPLAAGPLSGKMLFSVTAELATLLTQAHQVSLSLVKPSLDSKEYRTLSDVITRHLGAVFSALYRHGYTVRPDWELLVNRLCITEHPAFLHGDLVPGNVVRDVADGGLRLLDSCAYVGPLEFDAARWAARTGAAQFGEQVLELWLQTEPGLEHSRARALLGLELLMEAGVRELVKEEQQRPAQFPDEETLARLAVANRLLDAPVAL